jgi:hypothetical protein
MFVAMYALVTTEGCFKQTMNLHARTVAAKKTNTRHRKNNNSTKFAEPHGVPKIGAPSFTPLGDKSNVVTMTLISETKTENPSSSQLNDEAKKAEISTIFSARR